MELPTMTHSQVSSRSKSHVMCSLNDEETLPSHPLTSLTQLSTFPHRSRSLSNLDIDFTSRVPPHFYELSLCFLLPPKSPSKFDTANTLQFLGLHPQGSNVLTFLSLRSRTLLCPIHYIHSHHPFNFPLPLLPSNIIPLHLTTPHHLLRLRLSPPAPATTIIPYVPPPFLFVITPPPRPSTLEEPTSISQAIPILYTSTPLIPKSPLLLPDCPSSFTLFNSSTSSLQPPSSSLCPSSSAPPPILPLPPTPTIYTHITPPPSPIPPLLPKLEETPCPIPSLNSYFRCLL